MPVDYVTFPPQLDVRCPACGARALWDEPFQFVSGRAAAEADPRRVHAWGRQFVIEKYPAVLQWQPKAKCKSYTYRQRGVIKCLNCHRVAAHTLHWDSDAFYRWDIRGTPLWAWNRAHALDILHYVESAERVPEKFAYCYWLKRLPRETLSAKVRDLVVKRIGTTLAQE